ncbi:MAG: ABC transporter permease [bacterium]|nr:ABC transporter permease [bacterium]
MSRLKAVFKKELKDSMRDRRALMVAMLPAIFGPVLMMLLLSSAADTVSEADDLTLPVIGREHAPDLVAYLERNDIRIVDFEGDAKSEIQAKNVSAILSIPEDYGEKFEGFQPASVQLFGDESLDKSKVAMRRATRLIEAYGRNIGAFRLMLRGVNPTVASPVQLEIRDFSTPSSRAAQVLATMQMLMLMAAFFGGAGAAIDTTAGERERSSLEPLLMHPVSSLEIMGGKWITVTIYAILATLLAVLSTAITLEFVSLEALGVDPKLTVGMQVALFVMLIPMAFLASSTQMLASLFAKTFKEAQTYLGLLTLLPIIPVMFTMFRDVKTAAWMYWVPIMGQQQLMTSVMRGEDMAAIDFAAAAFVTAGLALGFFAVLTRLLRSERVVYGG